MNSAKKQASGKETACQCRKLRDVHSIPGLGRSPGVGNGNPLQYSWLENSTDRKDSGKLQSIGSQELDMTEWLSAHTFEVTVFFFFNIGISYDYYAATYACILRFRLTKKISQFRISNIFEVINSLCVLKSPLSNLCAAPFPYPAFPLFSPFSLSLTLPRLEAHLIFQVSLNAGHSVWSALPRGSLWKELFARMSVP